VVDVVEQEGEIVHHVAGELVGPTVHGQILWPRRFDHMQQHTGQHILSQAFLQKLGAQTVSFHLGEESSTIDLDRATLEPAQVEAVEDLANEVVFGDRPVVIRFLRRDELSGLDLRKDPTITGDIRIVQVEGFDRSACGGTHCARTGEVGPVAIRKWERRGQETRVEFLCGWRAQRDYRWKTATVNELALAFSVKDRELAGAVQRLLQEAEDHRRQLSHLQDQMLEVEAPRLLSQALVWNEKRVVVHAFADREMPQVRKLAALLAETPQTIALLGIPGAQARLVFARSADVASDMSALLKKTCQAFGGNGGGQPQQAQGGGFPGDKVGEALQWAFHTLTAQ
jgi:alanyl-tRNA synthetase